MARTFYKSKIDWWIYLAIIIMVSGGTFGLLYENEFLGGIILGAVLLLLSLFAVTGVKYEICDKQLGIRNFYRWTWIPIEKVVTVEKLHGIFVQGAVSATLSLDRVRLTLSDRSILRSSMPVDISPKDRDGFIARLKDINPNIIVKRNGKQE